MSLFYRLNKKWRVTNHDYARSWLEKGLTEAEFKIYPYTGETTCACDGIKTSVVADVEGKDIEREIHYGRLLKKLEKPRTVL